MSKRKSQKRWLKQRTKNGEKQSQNFDETRWKAERMNEVQTFWILSKRASERQRRKTSNLYSKNWEPQKYMIATLQTFYFIRGKIKSLDLHQSNLAINSSNRNFELGFKIHNLPVPNTRSKWELILDLSDDLKHAWI